MIERIRNIVNEQFIVGTRVVNCVVHERLKVTERPRGCNPCRTDLENHMGLALRTNTFMNSQLDRIRDIVNDITKENVA